VVAASHGLDLVRLEQHWALARIFTPLRRGDRPRLDVTLTVGDTTLRVVAPWVLGIDDLGVLLALLRLALLPERSGHLSGRPQTPVGSLLASELDVRQVDEWETRVVDTSLREIGRTAGRGTGGANLRAVTQSLVRLATVTVFVRSPTATVSAHILGWSGIGQDGRVRVALHPHVAAAVVGGPATRVDMHAWRALHGEVARRLLVWLSAWLRADQTRAIRLDSLANHVWAEVPSDRRAASKRRAAVRDALGEVDGLDGWTVGVDARTATITRHAAGSSPCGTSGDNLRHNRRQSAAQQATPIGQLSLPDLPERLSHRRAR
jgi:hypothetical protein